MSANDRRHLKADPIDPIEGFRVVLTALDQAMVQTVGSTQTIKLFQEVVASHDLDRNLETRGIRLWEPRAHFVLEHSTGHREAEHIHVADLPLASASVTPPLTGDEYPNYLSDSTASSNVFGGGSADFEGHPGFQICYQSGEIWCSQSWVAQNYHSATATIAPASMHLQSPSLDSCSPGRPSSQFANRDLESIIPE